MSAAWPAQVLSIQFVDPEAFERLDETRRDPLIAQGFSAAVGDCAVLTQPTVEFYCGLGDRPTRSAVRRAVEALPVREGAEVRVAVAVSDADCQPQIVQGAVAELLVRGLRVADSGLDARSHAWALSESLAVQRAREWTNASGQELTPERFARVALDVANEVSLAATVLDEGDLEDGNFGAILAVGQGSVHKPRLVDLRYANAPGQPLVTLVGKGITFDTGGLSLKSPAAMASMRMDKVGAASILAVMSVLPSLGLPINVRALLPLAENMVGPTAVRPGDVVVGRSGLPITIVDTDFEGRVLLSDALTFAAEESPDVIVDIAALTYQVVVALGADIGGLFSNDDVLAQRLISAGAATGDDLWRLPLAEAYRNQVVVPGGVKNHPETDVGRAITAGLFLQEFVPAHTPWAHLDITGPAWRGPASGRGATGFGVRPLLALLRDLSVSPS